MQCYAPLPACEFIHRELTRQLREEYHRRVQNSGNCILFTFTATKKYHYNYRDLVFEDLIPHWGTFGTARNGSDFVMPARYYFTGHTPWALRFTPFSRREVREQPTVDAVLRSLAGL